MAYVCGFCGLHVSGFVLRLPNLITILQPLLNKHDHQLVARNRAGNPAPAGRGHRRKEYRGSLIGA